MELHEYVCCSTLIQSEALKHYKSQLGLQSTKEAIYTLASAISNNYLWQEIPNTSLVVRFSPVPVIAVIGYCGSQEKTRLLMQLERLNSICLRLRYVNYTQVRSNCELLAAKLIKSFSQDEIRRFQFVAIPRGGLFVMSMLTYILELKQEQLVLPEFTDIDTPLVIVDDCTLTGFRFSQFLANCNSNKIIFAHLYSHPELRRNLQKQETRIIKCLSAQDLQDHGSKVFGSHYAIWQKQRLDRLSSPRYWLGQPDYICFPWNEPDLQFWNSTTKKLEKTWKILPPEFCLKNLPDRKIKSIPVQIQPETNGMLIPSKQTIFAEFEGGIIIGKIGTGESFFLNDVAADIWQAIVQNDDNFNNVIFTISRKYEVEEFKLRNDFQSFTSQLLDLGLLTRKNHNGK